MRRSLHGRPVGRPSSVDGGQRTKNGGNIKIMGPLITPQKAHDFVSFTTTGQFPRRFLQEVLTQHLLSSPISFSHHSHRVVCRQVTDHGGHRDTELTESCLVISLEFVAVRSCAGLELSHGGAV